MTVACSDLNPKRSSPAPGTRSEGQSRSRPRRTPRSREGNASGVGRSLVVTGQSRSRRPPRAPRRRESNASGLPGELTRLASPGARPAPADAARPSTTRRRAELSPGAAQALSQLISETVTSRDGKRQRKVPRPAADQVPIERRVDDPELQRADDPLVVRQNP